MTATGQLPKTSIVERLVPPISTAANDGTALAHVVDLANSGATGVVTAVQYIPEADKSGVDTNTRTLTLYNRTFGSAGGTGTTKIAELALTNGVNLSQGTAKTITLQAAANLVVTHGDRLQWASAHGGTGMTDPGGLLRITYTRD